MTNDGKPEVISLIRFSTAEQVAEGRAGIDGQRRVNITSAAYHGVEIRREIVAVDVSGRHVNNDPNFRELFEELKNPTLSGVLVPEQSRVFRPENYGDYAILDHFARNHKLIYTPTARIDPTTPEGRMTLVMGGLMSGEELHKIKERCQRGKAVKRLEGKHAGGNQILPRGVRFMRERNANGKIVATKWETDPVEMDRMRLAFRLLFEGDSFEVIAQKIGGGWTGKGIRDAMQNPIWIGIRRYWWEAKGEEYMPRATPKNPKPKMRRRVVKRAVPLDVPTRDELERGEKPPIIEPIISLREWDRAQEIIAARTTRWRKSKLKNEGRARFLGSGISECSCGQPMYTHYGGRGAHLDTYFCKSRYPKGKGCGARRIKRVDVDAAIEQMVSRLADAEFMIGVLKVAMSLQEAASDPARVERERALAKLANGRAELLKALRGGDITRDEFKAEAEAVEREVRALEAQLPAPAPRLDAKEMVDLISRAFVEFQFLTFTQKRALLRGAVKKMVLDSHARVITTVTLSGGYLGKGVNSVLRSTSLCSHRCQGPKR
jgi:DNA invertase Pin-like site-specific DNA recombinase